MPLDQGPNPAHVWRMVMPEHLCPYGLKAVSLLRREGYKVDDHPLTSREETDAYLMHEGVSTTPQIFIAGERIGGYDDLREWLGKRVLREGDKSYRPVLAIFAVAALIALAVTWLASGTLVTLRTPEWFIATAMVLLGLQKLQDVESFSTMFLGYDLLARRWVPYGYLYPYLETGAGVLMLAGVAIWLAAPVALVIGAIGAVSVIKAVYVDRRELTCACVGGGSTVPLGAISLTENLCMLAMGLWMPVRMLLLQ